MKVVVFENNFGKIIGKQDFPIWYLVADSALSNVGKPFYRPDSFGEVTASLGLAIKCCKLGKSISSRFAERYYKEYAPMIHFRLESLKNQLSSKGYPVSAAVSFDRSVMVGNWKEIPSNKENINLQLKLNGEFRTQLSYSDILHPLEKLLESYSGQNTIKMGDIIIPAITEGIPIREGDYLEVEANMNPEFSVKVR